jgi:hypothetical protein
MKKATVKTNSRAAGAKLNTSGKAAAGSVIRGAAIAGSFASGFLQGLCIGGQPLTKKQKRALKRKALRKTEKAEQRIIAAYLAKQELVVEDAEIISVTPRGNAAE